MKRRLTNRLAIYLFVLFGAAMLATGCKTSRNCGCGSDILGNYKAPKRYR